MKKNKRMDLDAFCYNIKQKVMRLCCLGMASDGSLSKVEKQTIVEILLRDVTDNEDVIRKSLEIEINKAILFSGTPEFIPFYEFEEDDFKENSDSIRIRYIYKEKEYKKDMPLNKKSNVYKLYESRSKYREKSYLKEMYCLAFMYVEFLYRVIKSNPTYCQNVFLNIDNIKRHEKLKEIQDMILVIRSDSQITSIEYSSIIAILKIFKVANSEFVWNQLLAENKENLWKSNNCRFRVISYFNYTVRDEINVYDVEEIQYILENTKFQGILANEILNAVKHAHKIKERTIKKNNQKLFVYSLYAFTISAILTFFYCAFMIENKKIAAEYNLKDTTFDRAYIEYARRNMVKDKDLVTSMIIEKDSIFNSCETEYVKKGVKEYMDNISKNNEYNPVDKVEMYAKNYIDSISKGRLNDSEFIDYTLSHLHLNGDEKIKNIISYNIGEYIMLFGFGLLLCFGFGRVADKLRRRSFFVRNLTYLIYAFIAIFISYNYIAEPKLNAWYNTFLVAVMMISIEIMVLTRELSSKRINFISDETKKISHQSSKGLLIVFVLAAIIADMCIGYIELPYLNSENTDFYQYMLNDKLASALLLGCISFFTGKFIEQHSIQQEIDIETMKVAIEDLDKTYK